LQLYFKKRWGSMPDFWHCCVKMRWVYPESRSDAPAPKPPVYVVVFTYPRAEKLPAMAKSSRQPALKSIFTLHKLTYYCTKVILYSATGCKVLIFEKLQ
jgi:hypothetical protein